MADPQILSTLRRKREEIEGAIIVYEKKLEAARRDLASIAGTIALFEEAASREEMPAYADVARLFKRGEIAASCKTALAVEGPLDTRELAMRVMRAKGLDAGDIVLRKAITYRIVQALTMQLKRSTLGSDGKRNGVRLWRIA